VSTWREDGTKARSELGMDAGVGVFEASPTVEFSIGDGGIDVRW